MADWQGMKGILVDRKSHRLCDFELGLTYDDYNFELGFSRSNFEKALVGMGGSIDMERKGCESILLYPLCDLDLWPHSRPWTGIFKVKFLNSYNSGVVGLIYM